MKKIFLLSLKIFLILLFLFLLLASIAAPVLILAMVLIYGPTISLWMWYRKIKNLPILTNNARVISKDKSVVGSIYFVGTNHYITFEFADGTRKTLLVPIKVYGSILEGENGIVSYKERKTFAQFIDFQRDNVSSRLC